VTAGDDAVPVDLSSAEVREVLTKGTVTVTRPIAIDDTPISDADADACVKQRGIPSNATNVRFMGMYLKCDSPDGSVTVSSRVECPFGRCVGDRVWVREAWRPDSSHDPDDTRYLADQADDMPDDWRDALEWHEPETMPRIRSRVSMVVARVSVSAGPVHQWIIRYNETK
jgi:hypothetical protein